MSRFPGAVAVGALAGGAALVAALVALLAGHGSPASPPRQALAVSTSIAPRVAAFGETVTARIAVVLDRRVVDPRSLERRGSFAPWVPAGEATVARSDAGPSTVLRYTILLRCLQRSCLPPLQGGRLAVQLPELHLAFRRRDGSTGTRTLRWAPFEVVSRLTEAEVARLNPSTQPPFQADLSLPPPTYDVRPGLLVALLAAGGGLLLAAAGGLVISAFAPGVLRLALPRRRRLRGTPLERALLLVERSRARESPARRKALDRLAAELACSGEHELSGSALILAWSESPPADAATGELAASVRERLGKEVNGRARARR